MKPAGQAVINHTSSWLDECLSKQLDERFTYQTCLILQASALTSIQQADAMHASSIQRVLDKCLSTASSSSQLHHVNGASCLHACFVLTLKQAKQQS